MVRQRPFAIPMFIMEPKPLIRFLLSTKITGIIHTVKYLLLSSAIRPVPHIAVLPVPSPPDMTFSDDNSDYDEGHGQQEGEYSDCDPLFGASCTLSEPHLLTKEGLNDILLDFNISKKKALLCTQQSTGRTSIVGHS